MSLLVFFRLNQSATVLYGEDLPPPAELARELSLALEHYGFCTQVALDLLSKYHFQQGVQYLDLDEEDYQHQYIIDMDQQSINEMDLASFQDTLDEHQDQPEELADQYFYQRFDLREVFQDGFPVGLLEGGILPA